jgi:predicted DNA-binding protein (MmcQ/YjbR family)
MADPRAIRRRLLSFACKLPGAYLDHPWGEDVVKVHRKIFVFLGLGEDPEHVGMTVKLRDEWHHHALSVPGARPTAYGLGPSGWVTIPFRGRVPELDVLEEWIEESYRLVAPKKVVGELDARRQRRG